MKPRWWEALLCAGLVAAGAARAAADDPGWRVAELVVRGVAGTPADVELAEPGDNTFRVRRLRVGDALRDGSVLRVPTEVEIALSMAQKVSAFKDSGEEGELRLGPRGQRSESVEVRRGPWRFETLRGLDFFQVQFARGAARTKGTKFRVAVDPADGSTRLAVSEGRIVVSQPLVLEVAGRAVDATITRSQVLAAGQPALQLPATAEAYLVRYGRYDDAVQAFEARLREAEAQADPDAQLDALIALGDVLRITGRPQDALARYDAALPLALSPADAYWKAVLLGRRGEALLALNRTGDAAAAFRESRALHATLAAVPGELTQQEQGSNLAVALASDGTLRCADAWAVRLLDELQQLKAIAYHPARAVLYGVRGDAAAAAGQPQAALAWHKRSFELLEPLHSATRDAQGRPASPELVVALNAIGADLRRLRRLDEADVQHERALAMARGLFGTPHALKADGLIGQAQVLAERGRRADALARADEALAELQQAAPDAVRRADALVVRAAQLVTLGRLPEALDAYVQARRLLLGLWPDGGSPRLAELLPALADVLRASQALPAEVQEAEAAAPAAREALARRELACQP